MPDAPPNDPAPTDPAPDSQEPRTQKRFSELTARLHAVEGERDGYRAELEASRRRLAERLATAHLAEPSDLWSVAGASVDELLNDDGDIDQAKVLQRVQELVKKRPGLAPQPPPRPLPSGGGAPPVPVGSGQDKPATLRSIFENRQLRERDSRESRE